MKNINEKILNFYNVIDSPTHGVNMCVQNILDETWNTMQKRFTSVTEMYYLKTNVWIT